MSHGTESNYTIANALTEVQETLKQFVCFRSPDDLLVTALYVLLTFCINPADGGFNMFPILPFLLITGEPGSGKTQLMKVLKRVCFRARSTSSISHAGFYRAVHNNRGTLLLDEAEDLQNYRQKSFRYADLLSGNERDGSVTLADIRSGGNVEYSTCGPKIFGNTKGIAHKALKSRCIEITLENPYEEE
jgi:hypothetical protein